MESSPDRTDMTVELGMRLIDTILSDKIKDPVMRRDKREKACMQLRHVISSLSDMVRAAEDYADIVAITNEIYLEEGQEVTSSDSQPKSPPDHGTLIAPVQKHGAIQFTNRST